MSVTQYQPIVIIGAPRSGTNLLRDLVCQFDNTDTWPCDEINAIWRHGNLDYPGDDLPADAASESIRRFIRARFAAFSRAKDVVNVVEKTCANSLRVSFVARVLPEARFIFIVRDGMDATLSAARRWAGSTTIRYRLRKLRYVPPVDLPHYALGFFNNRIRRGASSWGPRFTGMPVPGPEHSIEEICALQWHACVEAADAELSELDPEKVIRISYEDLVRNPVAVLQQLAPFFDADPAQVNESWTRNVKATQIGAGRKKISVQQRSALAKIMQPALGRFGYPE